MKKNQYDNARLVLSVGEAAKCIGISENKLRMDIQAGRLAHVRLGRRMVILVADLNSFLERHRVPALS